MEKLEKILDTKWGLLLFYIGVALISYILTLGINNDTSKISIEKDNIVYLS